MVTYQSFTVEYQRLGLPIWLLRDAFYNLPQLPTLPKKCDILPQLLSNSIDLIIDRMIDDIKIDGLNTVDGGIYDRSTQYIQNIQNNSIYYINLNIYIVPLYYAQPTIDCLNIILDKRNKSWYFDFKQQIIDILLPISLGQPSDNSLNPQKLREFMESSYQSFLSSKHFISSSILDRNSDSIPHFLEALEEIIMNIIGRLCFGSEIEDRNQDNDLLIKMKVHQFLEYKHFDIDTKKTDLEQINSAIEFIKKVNHYLTPKCKAKVISNTMNMCIESIRKTKSDVGADDFYPLFLYTIIHSQLPYITSTISYIEKYRNAFALSGGYLLIYIYFFIYLEKVIR